MRRVSAQARWIEAPGGEGVLAHRELGTHGSSCTLNSDLQP